MAVAFDKDEFRTFLDQKWLGNKLCPLCSTNHWSIADPVQFHFYSGGGLVIGGPTLPAVPLVCHGCGYTMFFNPAVTGFIKDKPAE